MWTPEELPQHIHRVNHDCFRFQVAGYRKDARPFVVYTDPFKVPALGSSPASAQDAVGFPLDADLVLISHEHFDHCSAEDLDRVCRPSTVIVAAASCREALAGRSETILLVSAGDALELGDALDLPEGVGLTIEAVPAYNTNKKYHPREAGHVGFVFELDGNRIYFAGDTDLVPEMNDLRCDIALLPVSGTYVMDAEEALEAAARIGARITVPMHYGDIIGTGKDAEILEKRHSGHVVIL